MAGDAEMARIDDDVRARLLSEIADTITVDPAAVAATERPLTRADLVAAMNRLLAPPPARFVVAYPAGELPVPGENVRLFECRDGVYHEIGGDTVVQ